MAEPAAKSDMAPAALHDGDFYAWTQEQAQHLRELAGALHGRRDGLGQGVDFENLAEEIESLGRSEKHALESRLNVLLVHLLKWAYQPERQGTGWRRTIVEQRRRISRILQENPSLASHPAEVLAEEYSVARLGAADETGLPEETFPAACPFTIEQILDTAWLPPARSLQAP